MLKCRSNCEDQVNSVFVTSSAYPNKRVFVKRPEFCYTLSRLLAKCRSFKRGPLSRAHPGLCEALEQIDDSLPASDGCLSGSPASSSSSSFSSSGSPSSAGSWRELRDRLPGCDERRCPLEEMVWGYARRNLAMLNIFIKVLQEENSNVRYFLLFLIF